MNWLAVAVLLAQLLFAWPSGNGIEHFGPFETNGDNHDARQKWENRHGD